MLGDRAAAEDVVQDAFFGLYRRWGKLSDPARASQPFGRRSWQLWGVPLAAGVAVVALAISPVVIKDLRSGPAVVAPPGPATVSGVPPYYVTLYSPPGPTSTSPPIPTATPSGQPTGAPCVVGSPGCSADAAGGTDLLVGDTLTGAKLAVVVPPKGASFYGVTGAANDRTFVVDTYASGSVSDFALPRTFYRLKIVPGAKSLVQLTRLPLPSMAGTFAMALSQSGTELAVARMSSKLNDDETWLQIYSVATGRLLRSWSTDNPYVFERGADVMSDSNYGLTWVDGDRSGLPVQLSIHRADGDDQDSGQDVSAQALHPAPCRSDPERELERRGGWRPRSRLRRRLAPCTHSRSTRRSGRRAGSSRCGPTRPARR